MKTCTAVVLLACIPAAPAPWGCSSSPPQSTRLRAGDFDETVNVIVDKLADSDFLKQRGPDSPPLFITINKVENLTTDVLSPAEMWMLVARVRAKFASTQLRKDKNMTWQLEPERQNDLRRWGFKDELGEKNPNPPTHVMKAVFRSAPRVVREDPKKSSGFVKRRQDYYFLEYEIQNVQTRQVEWTAEFEFKREAVGSTHN
jgi:hypothetical protein